jgi:uncharacterized membrane protein
MTVGPVQMLVLGFEDSSKLKGEILAELQRLKEHDIVRLIDAIAVKKDENGEVEVLHQSDLSQDEAMEFGAIVGALIGLGAEGEEGAEVGAKAGAEALEDGHVFDEDEVWYVTDSIPNGTAAAIALIEHRWAIPLRDAILNAGGFTLADEWIHAKDLVAVGLVAAEDAEAAKA